MLSQATVSPSRVSCCAKSAARILFQASQVHFDQELILKENMKQRCWLVSDWQYQPVLSVSAGLVAGLTNGCGST